jgi:hypothetical protein
MIKPKANQVTARSRGGYLWIRFPHLCTVNKPAKMLHDKKREDWDKDDIIKGKLAAVRSRVRGC